MAALLRGSAKPVAALLVLLCVNVGVVYILTASQQDQYDLSILKEKVSSKDNLLSTLRNKLSLSEQTIENLTRTINNEHSKLKELPTIFMITPTYQRWTQKADLTRLCMTLMHVPKLHWIIVEDSEQKTQLVARLLSGQESCKVWNSTHLNIRTVEKMRLAENEPSWRKNRGVEQRNLAIDWLRESHDTLGRGVVYFGDDDNTYDPQLFKQMRDTGNVSVWLVGITGGLKFEGPQCRGGHVTGWNVQWGTGRQFPIDMAGFAVNLELLVSKPTAYIDPQALRGNLESSLLQHLVTQEQLEGKPPDCKKVWVWHTRTEKPKMKEENKLIERGRPSNPLIEV